MTRKLAVNKQLLRYLTVGASNTVIGYLSFVLLFALFSRDIVAIVGSNIVGVANSYVWNSRWTFQQSVYRPWAIIKFVLLYTAIVVLNEGLLKVTNADHIATYLAQLPALAITIVMGYVVQKYWVFK